MPVLEEALVGYLASELDALVADRVVPMRGEAGIELPYVTYQVISETRQNDHDAFGTMRAWVEPRIQFTCWATSIGGAKEVGEALVAALNGYTGRHGRPVRRATSGRVRADGFQEDVRSCTGASSTSSSRTRRASRQAEGPSELPDRKEKKWRSTQGRGIAIEIGGTAAGQLRDFAPVGSIARIDRRVGLRRGLDVTVGGLQDGDSVAYTSRTTRR